MLTTALLLLRSSLFLSLHLAGNLSSFPKPLRPEEEQECLRRYAQGDMEARNILIERNLRLVAHIIKKGHSKRQMGRGNNGQILPARIVEKYQDGFAGWYCLYVQRFVRLWCR